jgi:hypothetical protein
MIKLGLDNLTEPSKLIPRKEIIKMGIPSSTFERWCKDKENPLPTIKIHRKVFVETSVWNSYVEKHRRNYI